MTMTLNECVPDHIYLKNIYRGWPRYTSTVMTKPDLSTLYLFKNFYYLLQFYLFTFIIFKNLQ